VVPILQQALRESTEYYHYLPEQEFSGLVAEEASLAAVLHG
jgi:hypothetical protein